MAPSAAEIRDTFLRFFGPPAARGVSKLDAAFERLEALVAEA